MDLMGTVNKEYYLTVGQRYVILDFPGLDGTTEAIVTFYDKTNEEIQTEYQSGAFTFVSCSE